jgi:murein DD-endopeptidase MepM/ murein hydrolase activator NlpD
VVTRSGWVGAYGYLVVLDHGGGWETRYAHLSRIDVRVGERVAQGAVVGLVGSTGASTGPHLHFEVRRDGLALDPLAYLER